MVGRSGAAGERLGEVTASARSLFSRASGRACEMLQKHIVTRPAIRSGKTDCRNMTCCMSICAIVLNISPERCVENPSPPCANVNVPGLERPSATSSATVFTGRSEGTTRTFGVATTCEIGARSLTGS